LLSDLHPASPQRRVEASASFHPQRGAGNRLRGPFFERFEQFRRLVFGVLCLQMLKSCFGTAISISFPLSSALNELRSKQSRFPFQMGAQYRSTVQTVKSTMPRVLVALSQLLFESRTVSVIQLSRCPSTALAYWQPLQYRPLFQRLMIPYTCGGLACTGLHFGYSFWFCYPNAEDGWQYISDVLQAAYHVGWLFRWPVICFCEV